MNRHEPVDPEPAVLDGLERRRRGLRELASDPRDEHVGLDQVALQHVLTRDPVRQLVVAAGGRLQLERIRQEQGRGESRLGVAVACPVEMSES